MGVYTGTYQTDLGRDLWGMSLRTRFITADGVEQLPGEEGLIPPILSTWVKDGPGPCRLSVTPRRALLYLSDLVRFELPCPFRGGTTSYQQFLSEIGQLPDVRAYDILSEQIKPYDVQLMLR